MWVHVCVYRCLRTCKCLSMCVNVFVSVGALWVLVCICVHVRVVMCVLLFNQQYEHKISNILSFDSYAICTSQYIHPLLFQVLMKDIYQIQCIHSFIQGKGLCVSVCVCVCTCACRCACLHIQKSFQLSSLKQRDFVNNLFFLVHTEDSPLVYS